MEITQKSIGELTLQLHLHIAESDYKEEVDKSLTQYRKQANIPGFRPGKVPAGMIKKMHGEAVTADVVSNSIGTELDKYLADNKISILGQPLPDAENQKPIDFKNEKEFDFFYKVGLRPEFELKVDDTVELTNYNIMFDDEAVEKYLMNIRTQLGTQTNPEIVSEGDVVMGSIVELDDDKNVKEGGISNEKASLSVDFIKLKTIKTKFIGKKVGANVVFNPQKAFKNDTEVGSLLNIGKDIAKDISSDFQFTIAEVSHIEPAEMNEELFSKVYENANITTEEELRARIADDIEKSYKAEGERKFFNDMVDSLIKQTNFNLPDEFLKEWIIESNKREEDDKRISPEELEQQYVGYRDTLRWQLIEEDLIVKNDLIVKEQELRDQIKTILGLQAFGGVDDNSNDEILNQVTDSVMQNKEEAKRVSDQVLEQKLIKFFKENANVKDLNISYDDFVEMIKKENAKKA
ncbi:MAG: trigger factor [Bacteroidetes bacterium]|nr:MAG: trigger factor [Bacteroidota bacterium]